MRTKPLRLALASLVAFGLVVVPGISLGAPVKIKATARDFWSDGDRQEPELTHVSPGARVVWVNPARLNQDHDVTAYGGNWRKRVMLFPGDRTAKRFRRVGTYKYFCRLHGHRADGQCHGMCGVVHVMR